MLIGNSCCFSKSPCAKNSTKSKSVHSLQSSKGFEGFEMSAMWNIIKISLCLSVPVFGLNSGWEIMPLNWPTSPKCFVMSVAKTASIINFLILLYSSGEYLCIQFVFSELFINENDAAIWWLSKTLMSLCLIAIGSFMFIKKTLFTPGCSKSWQVAATNNESISLWSRAAFSSRPATQK